MKQFRSKFLILSFRMKYYNPFLIHTLKAMYMDTNLLLVFAAAAVKPTQNAKGVAQTIVKHTHTHTHKKSKRTRGRESEREKGS